MNDLVDVDACCEEASGKGTRASLRYLVYTQSWQENLCCNLKQENSLSYAHFHHAKFSFCHYYTILLGRRREEYSRGDTSRLLACRAQ
jgi:hypothetical protein